MGDIDVSSMHCHVIVIVIIIDHVHVNDYSHLRMLRYCRCSVWNPGADYVLHVHSNVTPVWCTGTCVARLTLWMDITRSIISSQYTDVFSFVI